MRAFILVNTDPSYMDDVRQELLAIDGVLEAHMLYGAVDIIAIVQSDTMKELKEILSWKIRKIEKIRSSQTLITME
ncbi:MAG: Lrp/AsnC ligand binding domain-containing protein [Candidatus Bathyarchaeota archaeon]|jgi:DNA-binding Lrp family transcriptional regulator|nr:Lrp/AsnC ligand binding domain-containing protein [Candidatus Bathyarchaeota archaeon]